jgi:hypothetical protein
MDRIFQNIDTNIFMNYNFLTELRINIPIIGTIKDEGDQRVE